MITITILSVVLALPLIYYAVGIAALFAIATQYRAAVEE